MLYNAVQRFTSIEPLLILAISVLKKLLCINFVVIIISIIIIVIIIAKLANFKLPMYERVCNCSSN